MLLFLKVVFRRSSTLCTITKKKNTTNSQQVFGRSNVVCTHDIPMFTILWIAGILLLVIVVFLYCTGKPKRPAESLSIDNEIVKISAAAMPML